MKQTLFLLFPLSYLSLVATAARGQITPDGTVPTHVEQQGKVTEITGGGKAGNNLFHSFREFSISTGYEAFFNNGGNIENILSRVTGGNISNIDGLIRANGTANLFLINPTGIIFGSNARLDIGGSFLGSTATGLLFDDGNEFSATNISEPLLTINAPIGLNLRETTGNITNEGNLTVDRDLTLAGSNLDLRGQLLAGGNLTLQAIDSLIIRDSIENPFIAVADNQLSLQGDRNIDISALSNPGSGLVSGGNLVLRSNNPVNGDASFHSGGTFRIQQLDGSGGDLVSLKDPIIRSQGDVSFQSYQGASLHILAGGSVSVEEDIEITGTDTTANSLQENITLSDRVTSINIDGSAEPTLDIRAGVTEVGTPALPEEAAGFVPHLINTSTTATGSNITIEGAVINPGGTVLLTNQYQPNTALADGSISVSAIDTSNPIGNGGNIAIDSRSKINIANSVNTSSAISTQLTTVANAPTFPLVIANSGDGGAIAFLAEGNITTGDLNTSSTVRFDLATEVNTEIEANTINAIPEAVGKSGRGGDIRLQGEGDVTVGNVNSASSISIVADAVANDNFAIILGLLELEANNGGDITLRGNNVTTNNLNSSISVSDRVTSNANLITTNLTTTKTNLAVSQVGITVRELNLGAAGDIILVGEDNLTTGSLDSSVSLTNNVNNSARVFADNPAIATIEIPASAISGVGVTYLDVEIDRGGGITLNADDANIGEINTSISVVSDNVAFAEATASNDAVAEALANNNVDLNVISNSPGAIVLEIADSLDIGEINFAAAASGTNNLDNVAFSNSNNAIATAIADGTNQIFFDSAVNLSLLRFELNPPDVDNFKGKRELPTDAIPSEPVNLNTCPTASEPKLADNQNQQFQPVVTAAGKIYPARGVVVKANGNIILTPYPTPNLPSRSSVDFHHCQ